MSQTKVQLIQPIGVMTAPGVNVSGTLTATTFDGNLTGAASSIIGTPNVNAGIITAVSFYGNGENLTGVAGSTFIGVVTAAQSGTTTIDLSLGNIIYFTQDTDTTVAFANTESTQVVDFIRTKDDTTTPRSITWPDSVLWNGGTAPTLIDSSDADDVQIFKFITRDQGVTWYGYESMKNDPAEPIQLFAMGNDGSGSLAQNTSDIPRSSPVQIPGSTWSSIESSYNTPRAFKSDGTFWTWGYNAQGQSGQNDTIARSSPIQIPGTQWVNSGVFVGDQSTAMVKTDGTFWAWGYNTDGQLGQNDRVPRSSPTQLPGTQWASAHALADRIVYGIKTDGTLWGMGHDYPGVLGQGAGSTIYRSSPVMVPGSQWQSITGGPNIAIGLKTTGTLWSLGYSSQGVSAQNTSSTYYRTPTQIGSDTTWSELIGSSNQTCGAKKSDGTLWMWGRNTGGALGLNDLTPRSSPTQIPGTQWNRVRNVNYLTIATKTDGTLWGWGTNSNYALGDNIPRSSPYQIPGSGWGMAAGGALRIFAIKGL